MIFAPMVIKVKVISSIFWKIFCEYVFFREVFRSLYPLRFYPLALSARGLPTSRKRVVRLVHQNRTIAIASDFRVDGAKSPEIPQNEGVLGSEIAARNRKSLATSIATLNRNAALLSLVSEIAAISAVCDGHRNRKSQKSLRFRCAKVVRFSHWKPREPRDEV